MAVDEGVGGGYGSVTGSAPASRRGRELAALRIYACSGASKGLPGGSPARNPRVMMRREMD